MKAINAMNASGNTDARDLDRRHVSNHWDRAGVKRTNRRIQRHALRAELSLLVADALEAEAAVANDLARDLAKEAEMMSKLSFAKLRKTLAAEKPMLHLLADAAPLPTRTVTVVRKLAHRRRVVESVQVAYPLAA
jgi:hypothetical protein